MQFTLDQYDYIIRYMNEHYFNFVGGNSYLPPALKGNGYKTFQQLIFTYSDPVGDERHYYHVCKDLPGIFKKLINIDVVVIVDNFPYVNVTTVDKLIPVSVEGKRLSFATEIDDEVIPAIKFALKYPNKAYYNMIVKDQV